MVFGWGHTGEPSPRVGTYTVWKSGEEMVGGMLDLNALGVPAEVPPNWLVYFSVGRFAVLQPSDETPAAMP